MNIDILNATDNSLWDTFVKESDSTVYDTCLWQNALQFTFDNIQNHRYVIKDHRTILAGISLFETQGFLSARKLINDPFHLYNTVLCRNEDHFVALIEYLTTLAKRNYIDYVELVAADDRFAAAFRRYGFRQSQYYYVPLLKLTESYNETFKNYKKQFRTNLRKIVSNIEKDSNFEFVNATSEESLRQFSRILLLECKNKHYNFPPPFKLFKRLFEAPNQLIDVQLYSITYRNKIVAGSIILFHKNTAYYAWSAVDLKLEPKAVATYLLDRVIQSLFKNNRKITLFNLGLVSPYNKGLLFFKSRWGCKMTRPYVFTLNLNSKPFVRLDASKSMLKARTLVKYIPAPVFGKMAGIFYKYLV